MFCASRTRQALHAFQNSTAQFLKTVIPQPSHQRHWAHCCLHCFNSMLIHKSLQSQTKKIFCKIKQDKNNKKDPQ